MRARMQALPSDADARRQQSQAARQRLISRLNAALTPDQRARLAAMRGGARGQGTPGTVWVLDGDGPPRSVPVRAGITDGTVTEILSGALEPGASVVIGQERAGAAAPAAGRRLF
jgi:HlyD family secretion protein